MLERDARDVVVAFILQKPATGSNFSRKSGEEDEICSPCRRLQQQYGLLLLDMNLEILEGIFDGLL
jgi:hypothetical protein